MIATVPKSPSAQHSFMKMTIQSNCPKKASTSPTETNTSKTVSKPKSPSRSHHHESHQVDLQQVKAEHSQTARIESMISYRLNLKLDQRSEIQTIDANPSFPTTSPVLGMELYERMASNGNNTKPNTNRNTLKHQSTSLNNQVTTNSTTNNNIPVSMSLVSNTIPANNTPHNTTPSSMTRNNTLHQPTIPSNSTNSHTTRINSTLEDTSNSNTNQSPSQTSDHLQSQHHPPSNPHPSSSTSNSLIHQSNPETHSQAVQNRNQAVQMWGQSIKEMDSQSRNYCRNSLPRSDYHKFLENIECNFETAQMTVSSPSLFDSGDESSTISALNESNHSRGSVAN